MHERALMDDLVRKVLAVAETEDADAVTRIRVRLGALSHFTPEHFVEHWVSASRGTIAEGAQVDATLDGSLTDEAAEGVVLEAVEVRDSGRRTPCAGHAV
ncbi:MAG: hydrogenase/urease maturation nickel metallochaperone HypA [Gaiella sp.]|nr:hydrogenase/urease maturation nickel metallochaperone HypA [Gaiella sp.]